MVEAVVVIILVMVLTLVIGTYLRRKAAEAAQVYVGNQLLSLHDEEPSLQSVRRLIPGKFAAVDISVKESDEQRWENTFQIPWEQIMASNQVAEAALGVNLDRQICLLIPHTHELSREVAAASDEIAWLDDEIDRVRRAHQWGTVLQWAGVGAVGLTLFALGSQIIGSPFVLAH